MNKRTIILIVICCVLAVATVTMRYIQQEISIIRNEFLGRKQDEERSQRGSGSNRQTPLRAPQADQSTAVKPDSGIPPAARGRAASPPENKVPVTVPGGVSAGAGTSGPGTAVPPEPGVARNVRENASAKRQVTTSIEEVTTPLGPEPVIPVTPPPPEGPGAGMERKDAVTAGESDAEEFDQENAFDDKVPAAVQEQEVEVRGEREREIEEKEDSGAGVPADEEEQVQDEESAGEEEPAADEEIVEEEQTDTDIVVGEPEEGEEQGENESDEE